MHVYVYTGMRVWPDSKFKAGESIRFSKPRLLSLSYIILPPPSAPPPAHTTAKYAGEDGATGGDAGMEVEGEGGGAGCVCRRGGGNAECDSKVQMQGNAACVSEVQMQGNVACDSKIQVEGLEDRGVGLEEGRVGVEIIAGGAGEVVQHAVGCGGAVGSEVLGARVWWGCGVGVCVCFAGGVGSKVVAARGASTDDSLPDALTHTHTCVCEQSAASQTAAHSNALQHTATHCNKTCTSRVAHAGVHALCAVSHLEESCTDKESGGRSAVSHLEDGRTEEGGGGGENDEEVGWQKVRGGEGGGGGGGVWMWAGSVGCKEMRWRGVCRRRGEARERAIPICIRCR